MSEPQKVTPTMEERATRLMEELDRRMGSRLSPLDGSGKEEREGGHRATVRALRAVQAETRAETNAEWLDRARRYFDGIRDPKPLLKAWAASSTEADVVMHEVWKRRIREESEIAPDALPAKPE